MSVEFKLNVTGIDKVKQILSQRSNQILTAWGMQGETFAKEKITENGTIDTGTLRNSITYKVFPQDSAVSLGTNVDYGIYIELGTGRWYNGGRKTPWTYQGSDGKWHITSGQPPKPFIKPAIADHINDYKRIAENFLKREL